jgi:YVTN family beta-propeller protein
MRHTLPVFVLISSFAFVVTAAETAPPAPRVRVLVVDKEEKQLAIIDPATRTILASVPVGDGPHEVVASADGKLAIVSNYGGQVPGNTLSIIDLETLKETKRVKVAPLSRPHGLAASGNQVFFTTEASLAIARLDLLTGEVDRVVGTSQKLSHMIVIDAPHQRLYTANIVSGSLSAIEPAQGPGGFDVTQIAVPPGPEGIGVSPDGAQVWTAHRPTGGISVIDTATRKIIATLPVSTFAFRIAFTADGRYALATEPSASQLLVFDAHSHELVKKIAIAGAPLTVATDGAKRAYVSVAETNKVVAIDLDQLAVADTMDAGGHPDGLAVAVMH